MTLFPDIPTPHLAVAEALDTPRVLKATLRECLRRWTKLKGEIDFDDLLAMSAIRATRESDLFAHIVENVAALRDAVDTDTETGKRRGKWMLQRRAELEKLIDKSDSPKTRASLRALVSFVFPDWTTDRFPEVVPHKPQGLKQGVYWARYIALVVSNEYPPDQPVMQSIETWRRDRAGDLPEQLMDGARALHVQDLGFRLTGSELTGLLGACIDLLMLRDYKTWGDRHPPGLVILARLLSNASVDPLLIEQLLTQALSRAARENLPLMVAIMYWFAGDQTRTGPGLNGAQRDSLLRSARDSLVEYFGVASPGEIVRILRGGPSYTVYWLCHALREQDPGVGPRPPFAGWDVVAGALVKAALDQPHEVLVQIIPFVVSEKSKTGFGMFREPDSEIPVQSSPSFDETKSRVLFSVTELDRAFSGARPDAPWDPETRRMFETVRQGIRSLRNSGLQA
jgi:hypothetical protein